MAKFKKGGKAKFVVPDIRGTVKSARLDEENEIEILLAYPVGEEIHERWFKESELEEDEE